MKSNYPHLRKITSLVKFAMEVDTYAIKGLLDTPAKYLACYLSKDLTGHTHREIAKFFKINPDFMQKKIEEVSIEFLLHPEAKNEIEKLVELYTQLEAVEI